MPDPIDELEGFTMPTATPLPPGEVRRRGDRIRRRQRALVAAGTLAVVAVIATPFAVLAGHQGSSAPQPAPAPDWVTTVPASFDLTAVPDGSPVRFLPRADSVVDDFTLCGTAAFSTRGSGPAGPATDTAGATYAEAGTESSSDRTLAIYPDADRAAQALDTLRAAVAACPQDVTGNGRPYLWDIVDAPVPADDSVMLTQQVRLDPSYISDLTLFEFARVGNAIFIGSTHTSAGGPEAVDQTVPALTAISQPVLDQMCVFSTTGCSPASPDASEAVDGPAGLAGAIPDDFPLEKGLPTGAGSMDGPAHEIDLAPYNLENTLRACGVAPSGLPEPDDTFYAGHRTPAEGHLRTLMTFGSVAQAQAYAEGVLGVFANCPEDASGQVSKVYQVTPGDLGDYAASAVMRVEVGGKPGTGYEVVQVVRVGQAVLQTLVVNDGEQLDAAGADQLSTMLLENSQTVADAMG